MIRLARDKDNYIPIQKIIQITRLLCLGIPDDSGGSVYIDLLALLFIINIHIYYKYKYLNININIFILRISDP